MAKPRILVVYYSRTGTTRKVAEALTARLHCDSEQIIEARSRGGMLGYLRSVLEARRQVPSPLVAESDDPSGYDLVVIGTPVWAWSLASPVRAYLMANRAKLPDVAFFCTLGGAGSDIVFNQMQDLAGKAPVGRLALTAGEVASQAYQPRLEAFARDLQARLAGHQAGAAENAA